MDETPPWLFHVELQSSRDPNLVPNLPVYNALLERQHGLLVRTVVVLLRRAADSRELTGLLQREFPGEPPHLMFRYQVVRVWELPAKTFLEGGLGILPLAPLSTVKQSELPAVIARMEQRIRKEATSEEAATLWTAADVLMGLRYPRELVARLLQGIPGMKESVTYQAIVEEGRIEGKVEARQEVLLELGQKRFGPPDESTESVVRAITDLQRLKQLSNRLLDVSSWDELLTPPQ